MLFLLKGPPAPLFIRILTSIVDYSIMVIGFLMLSLVTINIAIHIIKFDIAWTIELCEFFMTWVTFLGCASVARHGGHLAINEFVDKLPEKGRFFADFLINAFCIAVFSVCIFYGFKLVGKTWNTQLVILQWPIALQYLALPVGCLLSAIFISFDLIQICKGKSRSTRYGEEGN